jgi:hypothetical protein
MFLSQGQRRNNSREEEPRLKSGLGHPDLVVRDENSEIYTVRYEAVNAMLLNEFLKAHRQVEEQESTIDQLNAAVAQQQKQIEALTATVRKSASESS